MDVDRLMELVAQYWDLAYAEGAEGRTHDTEDGAAQRVLSEIRAAAQALAVPEGWQMVPKEADDAMLRPFYDCPPEELPLAWQAALYIAGKRPAVPQEPRDA